MQKVTEREKLGPTHSGVHPGEDYLKIYLEGEFRIRPIFGSE